MKDYLFQSERLGFRNWVKQDLQPMYSICSDPKVMAYFPSMLTLEDTSAFINRMMIEFDQKGYCYFATDHLQTGELIGFIGLSYKTFESDFTPCVDIGWRLSTQYQGKGLATEGAKRCLEFGFEELEIKSIISMAPEINLPSINVMQKIGMKFDKSFNHPALQKEPRLQKCVLYKINSNEGP